MVFALGDNFPALGRDAIFQPDHVGWWGALGGIWGQAPSHCPGVSYQALVPGVWQGAEAEAMAAMVAIWVQWWASGGEGQEGLTEKEAWMQRPVPGKPPCDSSARH